MKPTIPKSMKAAVIDRFGGPRVLHAARIPVPEPGRGEVLIRVRSAGIGAWDPWLREGGSGVGYFPQVLGTDGAGIVVATGPGVRRFKVGDRVYGRFRFADSPISADRSFPSCGVLTRFAESTRRECLPPCPTA